MKKLALILALALVGMSAFAQYTAPLAANEGFVILHTLGLYENSGATLEFKESLTIGDRVQVLGRVTKFKVSGAEREYVRIKAPSGTEGWARQTYIVQRTGLAVVKAEEAIVYSEPRDVKITASTISHMTIVAVFQDAPGLFAKVVCYDPVQDKYYTEPIYVAREDLSTSEIDVGAVVMYTVANATKSKDVRAALFKVMEKRYSASIFFEKITKLLNPTVAVSSGGKATTSVSGFFTVTEDSVNYRATPDEKAGAVLGKLTKGARVEVVEATVESVTIGGMSAVWYRAKDPSGWIFGGFLAADR